MLLALLSALACAVVVDGQPLVARRIIRLPPPEETAPAEMLALAPEETPPPEPDPAPEALPQPQPEPLPQVVEPLAPVAPAGNPLAELGEIEFCDVCGGGCAGGPYCTQCRATTRWGRFARGVYSGLCCPDPCYEPHWRPVADAAFFTAAARPVNQQRFRWDYTESLMRPDRAEYFFARADGSGLGPNPAPAAAFGTIAYDELRHYTEVAHGAFGAFFEYSYRAVDTQTQHFAGFGDMTIGTKSLLYDTPLAQIAFQFQTHVPQGPSRKGLDTGHVTLEPGLVLGLNVSPASYLQVELSEWIPLGGDGEYAGAIFRYNASYNHVIAYLHPFVPLIGTAELNGWRFQDGAYSDPVTGAPLAASGETYLHFASGVRLFFCDRADFGVAYSSGLGDHSWTESLIRSEFRIRY